MAENAAPKVRESVMKRSDRETPTLEM